LAILYAAESLAASEETKWHEQWKRQECVATKFDKNYFCFFIAIYKCNVFAQFGVKKHIKSK
jgi:hypothetical protein